MVLVRLTVLKKELNPYLLSFCFLILIDFVNQIYHEIQSKLILDDYPGLVHDMAKLVEQDDNEPHLLRSRALCPRHLMGVRPIRLTYVYCLNSTVPFIIPLLVKKMPTVLALLLCKASKSRVDISTIYQCL